MKGPAEYKWRLSELTAARGLQNTTDRIPLLSERGIMLSQPRVYLRLVNQSQQGSHCRSSLRSATSSPASPEDLITVTAADLRACTTGTTSAPNVVERNRTVRPRRARIIDDGN